MNPVRIMLLIILALPLLLGPRPLQANELYQSIQQRLALMKEVAAYKWLNHQPIEVPDREALVIERAMLSGLEQGITVESSRRFFTAQIDAAKVIQQCWFNRWQDQAAPTEAPDLIEVIRPELLTLGNRINQLLVTDVHDETTFMQVIKTDCLSISAQQEIFDALKQVHIYPDRLTQIKDSGLLRIGTTGDYAPFSFASDFVDTKKDDYNGIDIDLAVALADYLQVKLILVKTSWPTLMQDLQNGLYDIAMSGVSRIPAREKQAYFSHAYHIGGKTPIARCRDAESFSSLVKIDQPETRMIVNPGGTNERYLDSNITRAQKVLHDDNRTIFDQIVQGQADIMITDLIEAQLQSARYPQLCMTMQGETLTYQEKAYMMPKDPGLLAVVNRWLRAIETSGLLAETFDRHVDHP